MQLEFSIRAQGEFDQIFDDLASYSDAVAERFTQDLEQILAKLRLYPNRYPPYQLSLVEDNMRYFIVANYRVLYSYTEQTNLLVIHAFQHVKSDPANFQL